MPVTFYPNLAFGKLELLRDDGSHNGDIPSWLVDQPDVLAALTLLAQLGGTRALRRAPDYHDAIVDPAAGTILFELGSDR